jgi:NADPH:quinone reductase-like Zn-dependent oxidoreductase
MSTNIKAYEVTSITGIDGIRGTEVRKPAPGPGQVHIRVRAASLNYRDLMIINGLYGESGRLARETGETPILP